MKRQAQNKTCLDIPASRPIPLDMSRGAYSRRTDPKKPAMRLPTAREMREAFEALKHKHVGRSKRRPNTREVIDHAAGDWLKRKGAAGPNSRSVVCG